MSKKIPVLQNFNPELVRNFAIIAHIDHGKSTLSDRMLEITGTLESRNRHEQFLDKLQVEKERGITVKAQSATMVWTYQGKEYLLNLIDTPGHVDFSYEVSRSLRACQGVLLVVDATQGIQAQTMANFYQAFGQGLFIIPVINKIDVDSADIPRVKQEMSSMLEFQDDNYMLVSGKTGLGVPELLDAVVKYIPAPRCDNKKPLKALLFDSWYDEYKGVILLIAVEDGSIKKGDKICMYQTGSSYEVLEVGILYPDQTPLSQLYAGQVGYIIAGMKTVKEAKIGDTIFHERQPVKPFDGFRSPKPMVFAGIFPVETTEFELLRDAIEKLILNDASVQIEKTQSAALGMGFRCGFLGLLHIEVFQQRLFQEYNVSVIVTTPTVLFKIKLNNGQEQFIENPSELPDPSHIDWIAEPTIKATIITPSDYLGRIMELCQLKRGKQLDLTYMSEGRAVLLYTLPLSEMATDFYDTLKSVSSGYASLDYEEAEYVIDNLVKLDILINGKAVDVLSFIVHQDRAQFIGREIVDKLKELISRQLFEVIIQAAIGSKIVARATLSAFRKNVIAKCYGGDVTRKNKLLEKQKEGKKEMKRIGSVDVPKEAFLSLLRNNKNS